MRGRPARAGERSTVHVDVRLTRTEYRAVRRLARANGLSVPDFVRIAVVHLAALLDEDAPPPIVLGDRVLFTWDGAEEFLPAFKNGRLP